MRFFLVVFCSVGCAVCFMGGAYPEAALYAAGLVLAAGGT